MLILIRWFASMLKNFTIPTPDGRSKYLTRFRLWGALPGEGGAMRNAYLHLFHRTDEDRELHNHPWNWSYSLILAGGYTEEKLIKGKVVTRKRRPFRPWNPLSWFTCVNVLGPKDYHRISALHGRESWSLFIAGEKNADWGFLVDGMGYVSHENFIQVQ